MDALVSDAHRLLGYLPDQELAPKAAEAVALLALIAGQDVEPEDDSDGTDGRWRIARKVAPDRVISTVDPEARHAHKTVHRRQDGFKAHIAVEPDTGLITDCGLTKAAGAANREAVVGLELLAGDDNAVTVLADSAYGTGDARAALAAAGHHAVSKPIPLRAPVPGGFTTDDFTVDLDAGVVTCPAGHTTTIRPSGGATFERHCRNCHSRRAAPPPNAAANSPSTLTNACSAPPAPQPAYPPGRPNTANTGPWVERSIAWLTRGSRTLRYRGTTKNDHWLHHGVAGLNLRRLATLGLTRHTGPWALA